MSARRRDAGLGAPRARARSSRASRLRYLTRRARLGALAARGQGAPAGALATASPAPRRSTCASSRSRGPTGSSTATSASTPTSSGPRSRSSRCERMKHGGFQEQQPARRRADDRDHRVRRRAARLRRRPGRRAARDPAIAPGEELEGRPGELPDGNAGDRRRAAAGRAAVRRHRRPGRGVDPKTKRTTAGRDRGRGRARRSRSRRRSGSPPGSCAGRIGAVGRRAAKETAVPEAARATAIAIDPAAALDRSADRGRRAPRARRPAPPDRPARARARRALRVRLPAPRHRLGGRRRRRPAGARRSASSSGSATRSPLRLRDARAELGRRADVEEANRGLLERMIADPERAPLGVDLQRGHRRARLPALALAPALGHARDADGLVAGQALLRLSVSQGAAAPGAERHALTI